MNKTGMFFNIIIWMLVIAVIFLFATSGINLLKKGANVLFGIGPQIEDEISKVSKEEREEIREVNEQILKEDYTKAYDIMKNKPNTLQAKVAQLGVFGTKIQKCFEDKCKETKEKVQIKFEKADLDRWFKENNIKIAYKFKDEIKKGSSYEMNYKTGGGFWYRNNVIITETQ